MSDKHASQLPSQFIVSIVVLPAIPVSILGYSIVPERPGNIHLGLAVPRFVAFVAISILTFRWMRSPRQMETPRRALYGCPVLCLSVKIALFLPTDILGRLFLP